MGPKNWGRQPSLAYYTSIFCWNSGLIMPLNPFTVLAVIASNGEWFHSVITLTKSILSNVQLAGCFKIPRFLLYIDLSEIG